MHPTETNPQETVLENSPVSDTPDEMIDETVEVDPLSILTCSRLDRSGFKENDAVRLELIDEMWDALNSDDHFLCLDTEFTGGGESANRLIELGICETDREGHVVGGMNFRCNPHRRSCGGSIRVHGISDLELKQCKDFSFYAQEFLDYIRGRVLIVHDATSDITLLNEELARVYETPEKIQDICTVVDSLQLARLNPYSGKKFSIDALVHHYDLPGRQGHHCAYDDAYILARIMVEIYLDFEDIVEHGDWNQN